MDDLEILFNRKKKERTIEIRPRESYGDVIIPFETDRDFFKKKKKKKTALQIDDNPYILRMIKRRMHEGREKYGQGLRIWDDASRYGTKKNSWIEHVLQEMLDATVYLCGALIRLEREQETRYNSGKTNDDIVVNDYRKTYQDL